VVQTTKVEEPAPETGTGSSILRNCSAAEAFPTRAHSPCLSPVLIPSRKVCQQNFAEGFARFTAATRLQGLLPPPARRRKQRLC